MSEKNNKVDNNNAIAGNDNQNHHSKNTSNDKRRKTVVACTNCRQRHIKCDGMGETCSRCANLGYNCTYSEAERKVVISVKYLDKLQNQISKLKVENANLRSLNKLKENNKDNSNLIIDEKHINNNSTDIGKVDQLESFDKTVNYNSTNASIKIEENNDNINNYPNSEDERKDSNDSIKNTTDLPERKNQEVIPPFLEKYGRLIHSRTGERLYIGSSNMTLFGLEIDRLVAPMLSKNNTAKSPDSVTSNFENETILEKEGDAYRIMLGKTHSRPGINVNFTLPSYSYAMLLVDSFVSYNDGCFYFFNEGLVKENLRRIYNDDKNNGFKLDYGIESLNTSLQNDSTLETIWFCKLLLIFATGEMYLGTANYLNGYKLHDKPRRKKQKLNHQKSSNISTQTKIDNPDISHSTTDKSNNSEGINPENINLNNPTNHSKKRNKQNYSGIKLPGSGFFNQASELFTGLFASGSIDNCIREGGIEVLLLYAFYLQVADCTAASYFYFGIALRASLLLGLHVDVGKDTLNRFELEHRRRLWWTVYMYERMLASKAGLPLSLTDEDISTELPNDFDMSKPDPSCENYIFPEAEFISNCVKITQINANILRKLYTRQPSSNILPVVHEMVVALLKWKKALPNDINCDYSQNELSISRLIVNMMTEYFQGVNLAVRPLLFHFVLLNLKSTNPKEGIYLDLSKYSSVILALLNASFQASINTIRSLWALVPENMVAMFGYMDREYLFNSTATLILFNATFGVYDATNEHLDHALTLFTKMRNLGNHPATLRREQILRLISILDFTGSMSNLYKKHNDNLNAPVSTANSDKSYGHKMTVPNDFKVPQENTSNNPIDSANNDLLSSIKCQKQQQKQPLKTDQSQNDYTVKDNDAFKTPNVYNKQFTSQTNNLKQDSIVDEPSLESNHQHHQHHHPHNIHSHHHAHTQLESENNHNHNIPHDPNLSSNSDSNQPGLFIDTLNSMLNRSNKQQDDNIGMFPSNLSSIFNQIDDISEFEQLSSTTNDMELWKDITNQAAWLHNDMGDEFGNLLDQNDKGH